MRLKKLTIHNIASVADAEIDFSGAPLASSDVFLICGETGAGKTTILDSICLALFGSVPRLQLGGKAVFDEIKYNDERQMLLDNIMPKMLVAGFVCLTITSVVITGVFVNYLVV